MVGKIKEKQQAYLIFVICSFNLLITGFLFNIFVSNWVDRLLKLLERVAHSENRFTQVVCIFTCSSSTFTDIKHLVPVWEWLLLIWCSRLILLLGLLSSTQLSCILVHTFSETQSFHAASSILAAWQPWYGLQPKPETLWSQQQALNWVLSYFNLSVVCLMFFNL